MKRLLPCLALTGALGLAVGSRPSAVAHAEDVAPVLSTSATTSTASVSLAERLHDGPTLLVFGSGSRIVAAVTSQGVVSWNGLDPCDVAAVESAALTLEPAWAGVLRALARGARAERTAR